MTERTLLKQTRVEAFGDDDDISMTSTQSDQYSSDQEFLVERVLAEKKETDGRLYFLILWAGYPEEKSTWEPKKNIQDPEILKVWKERKELEARGSKPKFNLAVFDAQCQELVNAKAARHRRRKHKRQRNGIPVSPSDSDRLYPAGDNDLGEAMEIDQQPNDDPGMKIKTKPRQKAKNGTKLFVQNDSSADEAPSRRKKTKGKDTQQSGDANASDDSLIRDLRRKAEEKETAKGKKKASLSLEGRPVGQRSSKVSETRGKSATKKPSHKPAPLMRLSKSAEDVPLAEHRSQEPSTDLATSRRRPSLHVPTTLSMAADRPGLAIPPSTTQNATIETRGRGTGRNSSTAGKGRGKGAMRGGSALGPKNVFTSSGTTKKRPTLIENAMDQSKDQKLFSNMHQRRKVQLAGREVADLAPDLAALGGLFDPSKPSTFQSLKPASFRKTSIPTTNPQEPDSHGPLDDLFGSSPSRNAPETEDVLASNPNLSSLGLPSNSSASAPSSYRLPPLEHDRHNEICYFWYTRGSCTRGEECKFIHSEAADLPIAPTPRGYPEPLPRPSPVISERREETELLQNSPISSNPAAQPVYSAPTQPPSRPPWQERNPFNATCYFWHAAGTCYRGTSCKYSHSESNILPIAPAPKPRSELKSQTCKFWLVGDCFKSAEDCQYHHGPAEFLKPQHDADQSTKPIEPSGPSVFTRDRDINAPSGPRKSVSFAVDESMPFSDEPEGNISRNVSPPPSQPKETCRMWREGCCNSGSQCNFAHDEPKIGSVNMWALPDTSATSNGQQIAEKETDSDSTSLTSQNITSGPKSLTPQSLSNQDLLENVSTSPPHSQLPKPEMASLNMRATKLSMDNSRCSSALKRLGSRGKEVTFGKEETKSVAVDFGDFEQGKQQPWGKSFSALTKLHFTQTCSAQDFSAQQGLLIRQAVWQGSLDADPTDLESLQTLKRVGEELRLGSAGLISVCADFAILVYPPIEEWKFIDGSHSISYVGRLKYLIFQTDLNIGTTLDSNHPTSNNTAYRKTLTQSVHGLDFKTFVPKPPKDQKCHFYLLFPSTANQTADFIISWLRACSSQCKIYSSRTEGAWDFFTKDPTVELGIVMIHETAIAYLSDLPSLLTLIVPSTPNKSISFWYISNSISPYPLFPPPEDSTLGQITATRLLPHGHAFFLTPSFLVAEPNKAYILLKWFKGRFAKATSGTWKLLCCHNVRQYLLDVALEKSSERDEMEKKYLGEIRKDAIIKEKGLGYTSCEERFKLHEVVTEMLTRPTSENFSDYDSDMPDEAVSPIIYADESIDPDDEQALVTWFAGWSMFKLDQFRKFTVVGTSPEAEKRAVRKKQFTTRKAVDLSEEQTNPSMTTKPFVIPKTPAKPAGMRAFNAESPSSAKKRQALKVAAKLSVSAPKPNASIPANPLSTAKAQEKYQLESMKISAILEPTASSPTVKSQEKVIGKHGRRQANLPNTAAISSDEPDLAMDIDTTSDMEAPTPKHGINSKATVETLHFITITGSNLETARKFLSKSNNDVQRAIQMYTTETTSIPNLDGTTDDIMDIDAKVIDLIIDTKSSNSHQIPRLATDDVARAINLYSSNKLSPPSDDVVFSPQFNGTNIFSPPQFDGGVDERPRSSASGDSRGSENSCPSSRAGVQTNQAIPQGFVPDADKDARKNTRVAGGAPLFEGFPRNGSAGGSGCDSADASRRGSPAANYIAGEQHGDRMEVDSPTAMAEGSRPRSAMRGNGGGKNVAKKIMEMKEIKFEPTTLWYGRQKAEGKVWQHIYVESWDKAFRYLGVK